MRTKLQRCAYNIQKCLDSIYLLFIFITLYFAVTSTNLNLRSDKSTNSNVISVIPKTSKLEVIDEDDEWLKVKYDSREGYVYSD